MTNPIPVEIYLSSSVFRQYENGQFNFLNLVLSVLKDAEIPATVLRKEPGLTLAWSNKQREAWFI